ncbi:hypothetical protein C1H46_038135 [Malus baccata]|uniref:Uncharacterized protein n=1 Tax=Malus baccata TaxID=106549 RepID=A0A540KQA4_MALBA|nr:hypothetical protein C1H46_038135 [Malus baccata]
MVDAFTSKHHLTVTYEVKKHFTMTAISLPNACAIGQIVLRFSSRVAASYWQTEFCSFRWIMMGYVALRGTYSNPGNIRGLAKSPRLLTSKINIIIRRQDQSMKRRRFASTLTEAVKWLSSLDQAFAIGRDPHHRNHGGASDGELRDERTDTNCLPEAK